MVTRIKQTLESTSCYVLRNDEQAVWGIWHEAKKTVGFYRVEKNIVIVF